MKEVSERCLVGNNYEIEVVERGFILSYYVSGDRKRCFSNFSDMVNFLASRMNLIGIGEEVEVKLKEDSDGQ